MLLQVPIYSAVARFNEPSSGWNYEASCQIMELILTNPKAWSSTANQSKGLVLHSNAQ